MSLGELPGEDVPEHQVDQQVAALDDVSLDLVQQPLAPAHPAAADGGLAAGHAGPSPSQNAERAAASGSILVEVGLVGALQRLDAVVVATEEVRRGREPREVVGVQRRFVSLGERVVRRDPLPALVGLPSPGQIVDDAHARITRPRRIRRRGGHAAARSMVGGAGGDPARDVLRVAADAGEAPSS